MAHEPDCDAESGIGRAVRRDRRRQTRQKGVVIVLMAILLVVVLAFLALAVDVGRLYVARADLQTAADAAALAGASGLSVSQDEARRRAVAYAQKNPGHATAVAVQPSDVELIPWPPDAPSGTPPGAVRVTTRLNQDRGNGVALVFAGLLGIPSFEVAASATASFGARDVVVVLDYSASMSYDSQLRHVAEPGLTRAAVEQSLREIWQALGSPRYGVMDFDHPRVISSGTSDSEIRRQLGLDDSRGNHIVPYPYPSSAYTDPSTQPVQICTRGWSDYFDYVQGTATARNGGKTVLNDSHYQHHYGCLTLMDYFQAVQYRASPDGVALWQTPQEPITAVKDAVSLFLYYMEHPRTDDRVGLAAFTSTNGTGKLETPLIADYTLIETTSRHRQAGHYHNQTNIAAGIETACNELRAHGRSGAQHLIVLLSDGHANWYHNAVDQPHATSAALDQARSAGRDKFQILTISLGADADTDLMQQIANLTGGTHFSIEGGHAVSEYREQLLAVFTKIALQRSLKLVD